MNTLKTSFTDKSFTHEQVWRDDSHAIYRRWKNDPTRHHFECIRIQHWPEREIHGTRYPATEGYPSASQWGGVIARTVATLEKANATIAEMKSRASA